MTVHFDSQANQRTQLRRCSAFSSEVCVGGGGRGLLTFRNPGAFPTLGYLRQLQKPGGQGREPPGEIPRFCLQRSEKEQASETFPQLLQGTQERDFIISLIIKVFGKLI